MFGSFRTLLALVVVAGHLGPVDRIGPYAVFGFYALSGYLMTAIMRDRYGYTAAGVGRYAANRLLRIYPVYLAAMLLSVLLVALLGEAAARAYHGQLGLQLSAHEAWRNLLLVLDIDTETRWVPPAWALTVELFYYAVIGLGLSRNVWVCGAWLILSLAYTVYLLLGGASFSYRYFPIAAASLPFAMGAFLHHLQQHPRFPARVMASPAMLAVLATAFVVNGLMATWRGGPGSTTWQFYLNLVLAWGLIAHLALARWPRHARLDAALGELSYPVYLLHYQAC